MGLFGKKESCSICGSNKNVHKLSDGFACATCLYNSGKYPLQIHTTVKEIKEKLQSQSDEQSSVDVAGKPSKPFNSVEYMKGVHMAGLPLSEAATCSIYLLADKIIFSDGNNKFNLAMHKVTNVTVKTDTEIQQSYVSSAGGAVGGALLFGPLGAIVGGRAKKKTVKMKSHYLIFTYMKDESINYISFDVSGNIYTAKAIESYVQRKISISTNVDL